MMTTASEILSGLGKLKEVGDRLGISGQAIWNMKRRGDIPSRYWPALLDLAKEKGRNDITPESLMNLSVKRAEKAA